MSHVGTEAQVIWMVTGDASELVDRLDLDYPDEDPTLLVHAGRGTLQEARQKSELAKMLLAPDDLPEPLIVLAPVNVFDEAEVFASDAPGLVVSERFVDVFKTELAASCKVYPVAPVLLETPEVFAEEREALLAQALPGVRLFMVNALTTIDVESPAQSEDLLFVPGEMALPPFFRVPWVRAAVFVRDDVRQRMTRAALRGAEFNLDPWPLD